MLTNHISLLLPFPATTFVYKDNQRDRQVNKSYETHKPRPNQDHTHHHVVASSPVLQPVRCQCVQVKGAPDGPSGRACGDREVPRDGQTTTPTGFNDEGQAQYRDVHENQDRPGQNWEDLQGEVQVVAN